MRDSEIEQWVLREISLTAGGRLKEVCVLSLDGVVTIRGSVPRRMDRRAVHQAVERARGAVAVINLLSVRKGNLVRRGVAVKSQVAAVTVPATFPLLNHKGLSTSHIAS